MWVIESDALGVGATVKAAPDGEAGAGGGAGDQLDDHLVGQQGLAAPGLGDEGEQPMLDPVPPDAVIRAQALNSRGSANSTSRASCASFRFSAASTTFHKVARSAQRSGALAGSRISEGITSALSLKSCVRATRSSSSADAER